MRVADITVRQALIVLAVLALLAGAVAYRTHEAKRERHNIECIQRALTNPCKDW